MGGATLAVIGGFLLIVLTAAIRTCNARDRLTVPIRVLISVLCVPVATFSVFGFLAAFEPGIGIGWKIGYATLFATMLAAGIAPWILRSKPANGSPSSDVPLHS